MSVRVAAAGWHRHDARAAGRYTDPARRCALAKLTLVDEPGQRILPAFYSDNYLTNRQSP